MSQKRGFPQAPQSCERFPSVDDKHSYPQFLGIEVYGSVISWIGKIDKDLGIELTLESNEAADAVWQDRAAVRNING